MATGSAPMVASDHLADDQNGLHGRLTAHGFPSKGLPANHSVPLDLPALSRESDISEHLSNSPGSPPTPRVTHFTWPPGLLLGLPDEIRPRLSSGRAPPPPGEVPAGQKVLPGISSLAHQSPERLPIKTVSRSWVSRIRVLPASGLSPGELHLPGLPAIFFGPGLPPIVSPEQDALPASGQALPDLGFFPGHPIFRPMKTSPGRPRVAPTSGQASSSPP